MRRPIFWGVYLGICLGVCSVVAARDIYVDNVAGDDRNDGTSAQGQGGRVGPVRSITIGLRRAGKGDRVIVQNTGTAYRESITLQGSRQSGFVDRPFELVGNGAVLDGTASVPATAWQHFQGNLFRFQPPKMSHQMLYLQGKPAERMTAQSLAELNDLPARQWCLYEGHIYFCVEEGQLPQAYDLAYSGLTVGVTLYEVRHVLVRDLVIQGYQLDGVNAHDGVFQATLSGVTSRGNGRSGISIGGASRVRVESCLVGNNGSAQVRTEGSCKAQLVGCDLLDNTAPKIVQDGGQVDEQ